ncbi:MAG: selenide, water dikinase SelD, partial [Gammaproteobacteria bacterium]
MLTQPITHDIVLVGGGHAHIEVLRRFGMRPAPGVRLTLISREVHTPYSGMLPGLVAGHYAFDETHIDLAPLAHFAGARLYHDEVVGLDLLTRHVHCRTRPPVSFDLLSIDCGATPALAAAGAREHAVPVKPVSSFHARWEALCARVRGDTGPLTIGVVGGGAGGVELVMALREGLCHLPGVDPGRLAFHLVTAGSEVLPGHPPRARRLCRRALAAGAIAVTTGFAVTTVTAGVVHAADGRRIALDEILWVTQAAAPAWPREAGLACDADGFIRVDACLRSVSAPEVFAAGDVAAVEPHPRPKAGVFAVRQGPPLADNLRRAARGEGLRPFTPQRHFLSLVTTGPRHAIAARGPLALAGRWVWRWKDHIDRRFMRRYTALPAMNGAGAGTGDSGEDAMRCGGCGAKVGAEVLRAALAALVPPARADVLIGIGEPDDAAVVALPPGSLAVHSVDAFRSFIDDPWMLGRVAANHALNDIYAMGATPQTALAMVTLPFADNARMHDDLVQLLAGAGRVLAEAGVALVGGHTGEGAELSIGFAVNGHVTPARLVRKRGAVPGDALVLTRPLGSGVLFAAAMRGLARAQWIEDALATM